MVKSKQFPVSKPRYGKLLYDGKVYCQIGLFRYCRQKNEDCLLPDIIKRNY